MAIRVTTIDDLDGAEGAETIEFGLKGATFEIDLTEQNVAKLSKALEPFLTVARPKKVAIATNGSSKPKKKAPQPVGKAVQMDAIRDWGRRNGRKVSDRGRVPKDVIDAFNHAHAAAAPPFSG